MTAPSDDSEPRRAGAIPAVVASLALHAAALAAVIAGTSARAPHPPARLPDIAVDIVAPPAPDTVETVAAVERLTGEPPVSEPPVAAVQNAEAPSEPPAPVAPPPEASDASDAAPPVPIPALQPAAPAPSRKPKPAPPQAASTPASRPLAAAPGPAGPADAAPPAAGPTVAAAPLESPQPPYPATARRRGQQGRVVLSVRVSPAGTPEAVVLVSSSGVEALDEAARDAVRGWRFRPALDRGTAVAATVEVPVRFRLEED